MAQDRMDIGETSSPDVVEGHHGQY